MTKPLPIGIFKKEPSVSMDILNKSIESFDLNTKIGQIFVVDIEFEAYDDLRKKNVQWGVSLYLWTKEQGPCGQT